ncbi:LysR family transcriptional regulator [Fictibacillus barbaricus]|uniref:LysR family transcriptional regulator n=1 Tax=Fictibacillus barbaricus TaxID=182136 RepID=A0ABS2ZA81_9BACL|nr:LysR family transcriptional regulator [Fictibacillus barbaricus]MBN3544142.1 LysR family transcriptional regulator [Fictibacillus barbaricus]GGB69272.1 LysR family transcriptional regulator [Fictibacillus barbaricus]
MEFRQLEYFMAICEELHFTRAAEKLGITQPTLSHQIKALEDEIGMPLFDRVGKRIAITEAGNVLREQVAKIFSNLKGASEKIRELQSIERGNLSIGALPGEINQLVSLQLLDFHHLYPEIKIRLVGLDDLFERVLKNEIDLAVTILPLNEDERVSTIPLYREEFYLAVSQDHPLAAKDSIDFEEINQNSIVMFPQNHQCRKLVDVTCNSIGFKLKPRIETNTVDSIISLVRAGAGATILSKTLLSLNDTSKLKVIRIQNPTICRQVGIVYHKDKYISFAAQRFISLLTDHIKSMELEEPINCSQL